MTHYRDYRKTYPVDVDAVVDISETHHKNKQTQNVPSSSHQKQTTRNDFKHQLFSTTIRFQCNALSWTTDRTHCEESLQRDFELLILALRSSSLSLSRTGGGATSPQTDPSLPIECKTKVLEIRNWLQYYEILKRQCPSILIFPYRQTMKGNHDRAATAVENEYADIQGNKIYSLPQVIALLPLKPIDTTIFSRGDGNDEGSYVEDAVLSNTSDRPPKVLERVISVRLSPRPSFGLPSSSVDVSGSVTNAASSIVSTVGDSINQAVSSASNAVHHLAQAPPLKATIYMKPPHVTAVKSFFARHIHTLTDAIPLPAMTIPPVLKRLTNHTDNEQENNESSNKDKVEIAKVDAETNIENINNVDRRDEKKIDKKTKVDVASLNAASPRAQFKQKHIPSTLSPRTEVITSSPHWIENHMVSDKGTDTDKQILKLQETLNAFLHTCHEYHNYFKQRVKWIECHRDIYEEENICLDGHRQKEKTTEIHEVKVKADDMKDFTMSSDTVGLKLMNRQFMNNQINQMIRNETMLGMRKEENVTIATMSLSKDGRFYAFVTVSGKLSVLSTGHDISNTSHLSSSGKGNDAETVILKAYDCGRQCPTAITVLGCVASQKRANLKGNGRRRTNEALYQDSVENEVVVVIGFPLLEVVVIRIKMPTSSTQKSDGHGLTPVVSPRPAGTAAGGGGINNHPVNVALGDDAKNSNPELSLNSYWLEGNYSSVYLSAALVSAASPFLFTQELVVDWINTIQIIEEKNVIVIGRESGTISLLHVQLSSETHSKLESEVIDHYDYNTTDEMKNPRRAVDKVSSTTSTDAAKDGSGHQTPLYSHQNNFLPMAEGGVGITSMDYSNARDIVVVGCLDGVARLYQLNSPVTGNKKNITSLKLVLSLRDGHQRGGISSVAISRNGFVLYTGGATDRQVLVWDTLSGEKLKTLVDFSIIQSATQRMDVTVSSAEAIDRDHYNIRSITLSSSCDNDSYQCNRDNSVVTVTLQGGAVIMIDNAMSEQHLSISASPLFASKDQRVVSLAIASPQSCGGNSDNPCKPLSENGCNIAVIGGTDSVSVLDLHNQKIIGSLSMSSMHFQYSNASNRNKHSRLLSIGCHTVANNEGNFIGWSYSTALVILELIPVAVEKKSKIGMPVVGQWLHAKKSALKGNVFGIANVATEHDEVRDRDEEMLLEEGITERRGHHVAAISSWRRIFQEFERTRLISPVTEEENTSNLIYHRLHSNVFDVKQFGFNEIEQLCLVNPHKAAQDGSKDQCSLIRLLLFSDRVGNIGILDSIHRSMIMTFPGDSFHQITTLSATITFQLDSQQQQLLIAVGSLEGLVRVWKTIKTGLDVSVIHHGKEKDKSKNKVIDFEEAHQNTTKKELKVSSLSSSLNWECTGLTERHSDSVTAIVFAPELSDMNSVDGCLMFTGSKDGKIMLWNMLNMNKLSVFDLNHSLGITSMSICSSSKLPLLVVGFCSTAKVGSDNDFSSDVIIWDWKQKKTLRALNHCPSTTGTNGSIVASQTTAVLVSSDGKFILTGSNSPSNGLVKIFFEPYSKDLLPLPVSVGARMSDTECDLLSQSMYRLSPQLFETLRLIAKGNIQGSDIIQYEHLKRSFIFDEESKLLRTECDILWRETLQSHWKEFILLNCFDPVYEPSTGKMVENCLFFQLALASSSSKMQTGNTALSLLMKMIEACPSIILTERYGKLSEHHVTSKPVTLLSLILAATKKVISEFGQREQSKRLVSKSIEKSKSQKMHRSFVISRRDTIDPRVVKLVLDTYLTLMMDPSLLSSPVTFDHLISVNEICQVAKYWPNLFVDFVKSLQVVPSFEFSNDRDENDNLLSDNEDDEDNERALQSSEDYLLRGSMYRNRGEVHGESDDNMDDDHLQNISSELSKKDKNQSKKRRRSLGMISTFSLFHKLFACMYSLPQWIRRQGQYQVPTNYITPYRLPIKDICGRNSLFLTTLVKTARKTRDFSAFDNQIVRLLIEYKWQHGVAMRFTRDFIILVIWFFLFLVNAIRVQVYIPVVDEKTIKDSNRVDYHAYIYLLLIGIGWLYFLYREVFQMLPSVSEHRIAAGKATVSVSSSNGNNSTSKFNESNHSSSSSFSRYSYRMPRIAFLYSFINYLTDAENWINLLSLWLVFVSLSMELNAINQVNDAQGPFSPSDQENSRDAINNVKKVCSITLPFLVLDLLYNLGGFRTVTAPFTRKLVGISRGIVIFLMLLIFILIAFTGSFMLLLPQAESFRNYDVALMEVFSMLFGNFELSDFYASPSPHYAVTLLAIFLFVVIVVLLNLLIALMGDIQQEIQSRIVAETYFAQAKIILEYERLLIDVTSHRKQELVEELKQWRHNICGNRFIGWTILELIWLYLASWFSWDIVTNDNEEIYFPSYIHVLAKSDDLFTSITTNANVNNEKM